MRPTLLSVAALLLLGSGCSKPAPGAAGTALTEQDELFLAVCGGRQPCSLQSQLALGQSVDGRALSVVVTRSPKRRPTTERSMAGPIAEQPWERFSAIAVQPAPPRECIPWRTWLVSRAAVEGTRAQLLVARCAADDGERAPLVESLGAGEVRTTLTAHADHEDGKPAAGYTEAVETLEFGLEPPRVLRIARRNSHGLPGQPPVLDRESSWDWEAFHGHACWHGHDDCGELLPVAHIADDGGYGSGAWKTTALGQCALLIDGTPSHGIAEPPANPTASVRALLADDVLYLEVTDDAFVTRGAVVDALEVTWSSYEAKPGDHPRVERLTMDGKLTRAGGTQQVDVVEAGPTTRRFALTSVWPPDMGSWSLAYVDTDDGRTVRQRIASVPWSNETGQAVLRVEPQPTCTPSDRELRVGNATATDPDKGILP
jgi:hypothetical protein